MKSSTRLSVGVCVCEPRLHHLIMIIIFLSISLSLSQIHKHTHTLSHRLFSVLKGFGERNNDCPLSPPLFVYSCKVHSETYTVTAHTEKTHAHPHPPTHTHTHTNKVGGTQRNLKNLRCCFVFHVMPPNPPSRGDIQLIYRYFWGDGPSYITEIGQGVKSRE